MKLKRLVAVFLLLISMSVSGCASKDIVDKNNNLIYQESISPNEKYVDNKEDVVRYIVEVYQENDETISIIAKSNSKFLNLWIMNFISISLFQKTILLLNGQRLWAVLKRQKKINYVSQW